MKLNSILNGAKLLFGISFLIIFSSSAFGQTKHSNYRSKFNFFNGYENIASRLRTRPRIYIDPAKLKSENKSKDIEISKPVKKEVSVKDLERQAFELLNQRRIENGLKPVVWNEEIAKVARLHSQNMASYRFFSHQGLDGLTVDKRADAFGIRNWRKIGENIAYNSGYKDPVEYAVLRWMQSESHRQNLLSEKWKESGVGVAIADDGKTFYFTQVFMTK